MNYDQYMDAFLGNGVSSSSANPAKTKTIMYT